MSCVGLFNEVLCGTSHSSAVAPVLSAWQKKAFGADYSGGSVRTDNLVEDPSAVFYTQSRFNADLSGWWSTAFGPDYSGGVIRLQDISEGILGVDGPQFLTFQNLEDVVEDPSFHPLSMQVGHLALQTLGVATQLDASDGDIKLLDTEKITVTPLPGALKPMAFFGDPSLVSSATRSSAQVVIADTSGNVPLTIALGEEPLDLSAVEPFVRMVDASNQHYGGLDRVGGALLLNTSSDRRLKTAIEDMEDGLQLTRALRPRRFRFNSARDNTVVHHGFIAQEVAAVIPEWRCPGLLDTDEPEDHYYRLDYARFTPLLTSAIQQLSAQVEMLQRRVDHLERQNMK